MSTLTKKEIKRVQDATEVARDNVLEFMELKAETLSSEDFEMYKERHLALVEEVDNLNGKRAKDIVLNGLAVAVEDIGNTVESINETVNNINSTMDYIALIDDVLTIAQGVVLENPQMITGAVSSAAARITSWET